MQITWDLIVLVSTFLGVFYGVFLGRRKILGILVNLILAYTLTVAAGPIIFDFTSNFGFISARLAFSEFAVKVFLMAGALSLLLFKSETSGLDSGGSVSKFQGAFYGILVAGLGLSSVFSFMTDMQRASLDSNFANLVHYYHPFWVAAPVITVIAVSFLFGGKRK